MMHVRVVSPSTMTDAVVAVLRQQPTVVNLTVLPGAVVSPVADLVMLDVTSEHADSVIRALRARGLDRVGTITVIRPELMMSVAADEAELRTPGGTSEAVLWAEVERRAIDDSEMTPTYMVMMALATAIAAVGLLTDSAILVIGAMVIGPEYAPISSLGFAIFRRDRSLAKLAATLLAAGFALAIALTLLFGLAVRATGRTPHPYLDGVRPLTSFIAQPDGWSVIVALLAGIAGTLSLTQAKNGPLVGVVISLTTVPAAANLSIAIAYGHWSEVRGAAVQLALNIVLTIVAVAVTLRLEDVVGRRRRRIRRPLP